MANIVDEQQYGLASKLIIKCQFCFQLNTIETSSTHKTGKCGPKAYDINSKATLASLHAGIGETHLNGILSVMNIPSISRASFKNRERETGKAVEAIAKKSCQEAIMTEKNNTISSGEQADENNLVPISCSYDMGWQKRGKGFNSNTGQAAVISQNTGKILDFTTKNKKCRTCEHAERTKTKAKDHDCRKNHSGSSKSMEPISAVELFNNAPKHGIRYSTYTGDDDSTTELYIHQEVPYGVEKFSDIVHMKRSLTTRLYNLSKMSQFKDSSPLSTKVIEYLVKCFSIAICQNKGNPSAMKSSLQCIVPHSFGDHTTCSDSWCRYKQDPTNYKHTNLPYGKDLFGTSLKSALDEIFSQYYSDAVVAKLAPAANSQQNESFNSVVGSKNPKIRYYGGSESCSFRVACAVAQVNVGYSYVNRTLEALGIDPGLHCTNYTCQEAISKFVHYIKRCIAICKGSTNKQVSTVLIGHNARRFDIPILLRNSTSEVHAQLQDLEVFFGDSLPLFDHLIKINHPALTKSNSQKCSSSQSSIYEALFHEKFAAHDAKEDVMALRKILFTSPINLTEQNIITFCKPVSSVDALQDCRYLDKRYEKLQTLKCKLYSDISSDQAPITKSMAEKIAGTGLVYNDLQHVFVKYGKKALIAVLSKPPTVCQDNKPRVTKTPRIIASILRHFEENLK